ncbi:uncharacterized protein TNCV_5037741 [Trichonephila clavipes]|nr:uncharacterized protein TNCV_5037741 [Trichonephila clavipes]
METTSGIPGPVCQQGTVQASEGSVMVWGVCSWRNMGPLIHLDTTLISDRFPSRIAQWKSQMPENNIRRYPYTGERFEGQNNFQRSSKLPEEVANHWKNDPKEFEVNVGFDDNLVIYYDNGSPMSIRGIVIEDHKTVNRYSCDHLEEEIGIGALQLCVLKRQMTINEELTSRVYKPVVIKNCENSHKCSL